MNRRIADWLEAHWVTPAFSGWLLIGLSIFFFIAGTNTLSGWLYVLSGIGLALLAIAALLPRRTLRQLGLRRAPIHPVSAGEVLSVELIIDNPTRQPKTLLQIQDLVPDPLGGSKTHAIELIPPHKTHHWLYEYPTEQRGIYRWQTVYLRTANPLGLFWGRRTETVKAKAIVYPTVFPLAQCPLIDDMGQDKSLLFNSDRRAQAATEGLTRSLRPYRWGDPTRLVHWRSSARYNELRVRELEIFTGGQELVICLDSGSEWATGPDTPTLDQPFEAAVTAAATLYFYACHQSLNVKLWTAATGLVQGNQVVLETLAGTQPGETARDRALPSLPLLWLTQNPLSLGTLPFGSRWILWPTLQPLTSPQPKAVTQAVGLVISGDRPLQAQLQMPPTFL